MSGTVAATVPVLGRTREALERAVARADRFFLRLQGRVDTPTFDRWLPYGFAVVHSAALIVLALTRHHALFHGAETAKYTQAVWQISEDLKPVTTLAGGNVLAEQGSLILYPLSLITSILPRTETLLVIRSLALAMTIVPLWRLARRRHENYGRLDRSHRRLENSYAEQQSYGQLGIGATTAVIFAYGIYTYVHNMNIADFSPAVLAVPALMWAVLAGFDERKWTMVIAMVVALCCRADLGLAIAGLGVLLLIERRRRVGAIATIVGFGWFLVALYGLQRGLSDGEFTFLAPYAQFGDTPFRALWGIISHPVRFLGLVGSLANFQILVTLLAPVLFLPMTSPRHLMPAVPLYVLYMGADVPFGRVREAAQTVPMTVFVFVATVFALKRTGRVLVKQVRVERRIILALLLTAMVFFVRDSITSPYNSPWEWSERQADDLARIGALDFIPNDQVPVRASSSLLPLISERLAVYELNLSVGEFGAPSEVDDQTGDTEARIEFIDRIDAVIDAATTDVDLLIIDLAVDPITGDARGRFQVGMAERGWQLVQRQTGENPVEVYEFTGIIAPLPVAQDSEPGTTFGFSPDDSDGPDG